MSSTDLSTHFGDLYSESYAFGSCASEERVITHGTVYTPSSLAQEMVRTSHTFLTLSPTHIPACCDPSCGSGLFLLALFEEFIAHTSRSSLPIALCDRFLQEGLYGVDTDSEAIAFAKKTIAQAYSYSTGRELSPEIRAALERHLIVADALIDPLPFLEERHLHTGFDLVIGNPPYGLSRDGGLSTEILTQLKERYARYLSGRVNKYLLFMARAYEIAREGGEITFIVPNAWLSIAEAKKIRALYLTRGGLSKVTLPTYKIFGDRGVESILFTAIKGSSESSLSFAEKRDPLTPPEIISTLEKKDLLVDPSHRIRATPHLLIPSHCTTLGAPDSLFTPRIALQVYAKGKGTPPQTDEIVKNHPFHLKEKQDELCYPYHEGKEVQRFRLTPHQSYLRYGPWVSEYQPIERYSGPRIVLREVLGKAPHLIQAAFIQEVAFYNKSVLHILPKPDISADAVWALLALLNSPYLSQWLASMGNKSRRTLFPKLLLADLKALPIPKDFARWIPHLAPLAKECAEALTPERERALAAMSEEIYRKM